MSEKYHMLFPEIELREDQNTKGYFVNSNGGMRYAVGVGGSVIGMHAHFIIPDDPIDPQGVQSDLIMNEANTWMSETLSQRKVDKMLTPTLMVMQRLHQNDPTGYWIEQGGNIKHIILPAEDAYPVKPDNLKGRYVNGLLDSRRLSRVALTEAMGRLRDVGYAGQYGQQPIPRGGAMFKVDRLMYDIQVPSKWKVPPLRYWDKAISLKPGSAFTVGVKGGLDLQDNVWILDVKRGHWDSSNRELIIQQTAKVDGKKTMIWMEQEPASSGKESVERSCHQLALLGYVAKPDKVTGPKEIRADTFAVSVNSGQVIIVPAPWNTDFVDEMRFFPFSRYKDQIDSASGLFSRLSTRRLRVGTW